MQGQRGLEMCIICLETDPSEISFVKPCMHIFCSGCLLAWFKMKQVCPLCMVESQALISHADGRKIETDVKLIFEKPATQKEDPLDLDHSYFFIEVGKLERKAKSIRQKMGTLLGNSSRDESSKWRYFEYLENELYYLNEEIKKFKKFDQTQFLKDLLWIDGQFKLIDLNNWTSIDLAGFDVEFSSEVYYYENEDEDIKKSQIKDISSQFYVKETKTGNRKKKSNKNKK